MGCIEGGRASIVGRDRTKEEEVLRGSKKSRKIKQRRRQRTTV